MDTESPSTSQPSNRPRPWLLVVLGVAVAAFLALRLAGSATPTPPSSNPGRAAQQTARTGKPGDVLDPSSLVVNLPALRQPAPVPGDSERNPFRFQPKAPPPPPPQAVRPPPPPESLTPPPPTGPPPPPPIPLKYIGIVEDPAQNLKLAAFTDCRLTYRGVEGQIIAGQYRLIKIGVESVVIEYADVPGKGRTTMRMSGQDCIGK